MPSVRKIYKQGNTPIISLPGHIVRAVGAVLGSAIIVYPISEKALIVEVHNAKPEGLLTLDRIRAMRSVAVRTIYRQGNSFVCSIPNHILELIGIGIGDYLELQRLSDSAFTASALSREQLLHKQAIKQISYRRDERANDL